MKASEAEAPRRGNLRLRVERGSDFKNFEGVDIVGLLPALHAPGPLAKPGTMLTQRENVPFLQS